MAKGMWNSNKQMIYNMDVECCPKISYMDTTILFTETYVTYWSFIL